MKARRNIRSKAPFHIAALVAAISVLSIIILALCAVKYCASPGAGNAVSAYADAAAQIVPVAPTQTSLPIPSPVPTAAPEPAFHFEPDPDRPIPSPMGRIRLGEAAPLSGTIRCNYPLRSVSAVLLCDYSEDPFYPYMARVTFTPGSNVTTYRFDDSATAEGNSLASLIDFGALQTGVNELVISATCEGSDQQMELYNVHFYVLGDTWKRFSADDFSNDSYRTALAFFGGDPERFLYRYQNVFGRYTVAEPEWDARYITSIDMGYDEPWLIHIDAVPYYEKLRSYLYNTHVRVHGTNGDSGVLGLNQLIIFYHGSYVSRFTSAKRRTISHHTLGATTDVNAMMEPNMNTKANLALIDNEVRNLLTYNGVLSDGDTQYYDFTYSGDYRCTDYQLPETVVNYLLYELAFYRVGFAWGHYYNSTSDGMHFSLTDNIKKRHDGAKGLQKVTKYYN